MLYLNKDTGSVFKVTKENNVYIISQILIGTNSRTRINESWMSHIISSHWIKL